MGAGRTRRTWRIALVMGSALVGAGLTNDSEAATPDAARAAGAVELAGPRIVGVQRADTPTRTKATILRLDADDIRRAHASGEKVRIRQFPLDEAESVELELQPFRVTGHESRFVVGRLDGPDITLPYDASRISLFHGRVVGRPGSHVYLSLSGHSSAGYIDLGPGAPRHRISSKGGQGQPLGRDLVSVFKASGAPAAPPGVPLCGVEGEKATLGSEWATNPLPNGGTSTGLPSTVGMRHLELAIETDYELFTLFDDATAAMDYVVQMYGEVSAIYMRDVDTRIEIVFARVWDNANDLFNGPEPLFQFYPWWSVNMNAVNRDSAQFLSGRRDFPFGGQAYVSALCSFSFGYGVVGYAVGAFPDPSVPHPFNWDVPVTAHELGHSCGTGHTHSNGIDTCDDPLTTPRRGPLMSYCGQTWSGMKANTDNYFHTVSRFFMEQHISTSSCIDIDCNMNNIADSTDIGGGTSTDTNGNGVPDECEDCNDNGILDPFDIVIGASTDLNDNGVPDECEPDCNGNNVPDDRDILLGTSLDQHGNRIPDECETDCNGNGVSDYSEIQADITLDKDRNAALDSCQDCDTDGTGDLVALSGAHHLWVASGLTAESLRQFYGSTGVLTTASTGAVVNEGQDVIVTPSGDVLVTSAPDDRVLRFDSAGNYVDDLVPPGAGGLDYPTGLILSPGGLLLVSSRDTHSVLAYDAGTGFPQGAFVTAGSGGLAGPFGLTYGPNGNLFVTSDADEVIEYDGTTGALVGVFVSAGDNGGLEQPRGLAFKPDGNLLVASYGTDEVLEYDRIDGAPRGKWAQVGTETAITQDSPWGIRVGPNGNVFVSRTGSDFSSTPGGHDHGDTAHSHLTDARMFEYDVCTGDFRKTEIGGNDHGLQFATGFDFVPGFAIDCNVNEMPDSCDIASGTSQDTDSNGVPDECQVDCNGNGTYDRLDIYPFGASLDCNCNFVPDECDLAGGSSDCNANSIPDECEIDFDCNNNGTQDICEIADGSAEDCNNNTIIDACEATNDGVLLDESFALGLPVGWTATGIFSVTGSCPAAGACDSPSWAYAGNAATCGYGDGQHGGLVSPLIDLPPGSAELRYCSALSTELDSDFADVVVNNVRVERLSGGGGAWESRVVDLSEFAGESIQVIFRLQSDANVSGTLGWLVDNVQVIAGSTNEDCNANGVPDACDIADGSSSDADGNGVPDECDTGPPLAENSLGVTCAGDGDCDAPGAVCVDGVCYVRKNRYISLAPNPDNAGKLTARRVSLSVAGGATEVLGWVGSPIEVDVTGPEVSPQLTARIVDAAQRHYRDWSVDDLGQPWTVSTLHVGDCETSPGHVYLIDAIVAGANIDDPASYTAPLMLTTIDDFGDVVGANTGTPPDGVRNFKDISAVVRGFQSIQSEPKVWLDLQGGTATPELPDFSDINFADINHAVAGFQGGAYPFAAPCACPGQACP